MPVSVRSSARGRVIVNARSVVMTAGSLFSNVIVSCSVVNRTCSSGTSGSTKTPSTSSKNSIRETCERSASPSMRARLLRMPECEPNAATRLRAASVPPPPVPIERSLEISCSFFGGSLMMMIGAVAITMPVPVLW